MATYNIYEAKTRFSKLVEQAARGEEVVIAKAGRPVLRMVPVVEEATAPARRVFGQSVTGCGPLPAEFYEDLPLNMWEVFSEDGEAEGFGGRAEGREPSR